MLRVSIIIPVYNAEKTLNRCLNSVIEQTYKNYEVIIVDDGSQDNSINISESYCNEHPNIKLFSQKNSGPATARNKGINLSSGDYVYFLDADDYLEPDLLEKMVSAAEKTSAEMVICNYYIEKEKKVTLIHRYRYEDGLYTGSKVRDMVLDLINDVSETRIPPYSWVRMINRQFLMNSGIKYQDGLVRSEDYHFFVKLQSYINTIYIVNKPLYHYVEVGTSITHRYIPKYWETVVFIYKDLKSFLPNDDEINKNLNIMLIQRMMVALNNSSWNRNSKLFDTEVKEILADDNVKEAIKSFGINKGIKHFGLMYILLKLHAYPIIYLRYRIKFCKEEKKKCL